MLGHYTVSKFCVLYTDYNSSFSPGTSSNNVVNDETVMNMSYVHA